MTIHLSFFHVINELMNVLSLNILIIIYRIIRIIINLLVKFEGI